MFDNLVLDIEHRRIPSRKRCRCKWHTVTFIKCQSVLLSRCGMRIPLYQVETFRLSGLFQRKNCVQNAVQDAIKTLGYID